VDVVYRRTDEARLGDPGGELTDVGKLLRVPLEAGTLGLANAFGTGVGDDKLTHAYSDQIVRFYLGEEPELRSVRTFDLCEPDQRDEVLARLDELVVKVRHRAGGRGVLVEPEEEASIEEVADKIRRSPERYVAQERVAISTHPTVVEDGFEPRRVDLRPFVMRTAGDWRALKGGLTRFAATADSLVVNSTRGGGGKDTWVLT
jgi:carboxylate-amine ligase